MNSGTYRRFATVKVLKQRKTLMILIGPVKLFINIGRH